MKIDVDALSGQKFGKLTIESAYREKTYIICNCVCDCGTRKKVRYGNLSNGHTKTCGNHVKETAHRTHGLSKSRLARIYNKMKNRCTNPKDDAYKFYGLKGVMVCDEWANNPEIFYRWALLNGYTDSLTLDRIDVNGNYEPNNCRWIPFHEQCLNRSSNVYLEYNGERKTKSQWAEELNLNRRTIDARLKLGWSVEDTLTKPVKAHKPYEVKA